MSGGAENTFRLVEHVEFSIVDGEVTAVKRKLRGCFTFRDPREGAKVGEGNLNRPQLHLEKRLGVEMRVLGRHGIPGTIQHPHPIGDESPSAVFGLVELTGQSRGTTPA